MSKLNSSIILLLIFVSIALVQIDIIYKQSLPLISLPRYFKDTIGNIPIAQEMDKNFMEISNSGGDYFAMASGMVISYSGY